MFSLISIYHLVQYPLIILICLNFFTIIFWKKIFFYLNLNFYKKKQRIHENEIPRIGGFLIFVFFILCLFFFENSKNEFLFKILVSFFPILIFSLKEDFFQNTKPSTRIISMIISCLIFFFLDQTEFPLLDISFYHPIFANKYFLLIFFTFSTLIIINGINLIDGANGIVGATFLTQLLCLIYLANEFNDNFFHNFILVFIYSIIIFLVFNYPLGKIFLGDLGAYLIGFIISILTIKFFGVHKNLMSWNAILILFYPSIEILFSFIRKLFYEKKSPLEADNMHLHSLIFKLGKTKSINTKLMNNLIIILLSPFWLGPLFFVRYYQNLKLIILALIFLTITYILMYIYFRINIEK